MRKGSKDIFVFLINFSTNSYTLQFGVPYKGTYHEVLNTQWDKYGGNLGHNNERDFKAIRLPANNQPYRIQVEVPAFSAMILKVTKPEEPAKPAKEAEPAK